MTGIHIIDGEEDKSGNAGPVDALVDFYRAFNHQDFELMKANWLHSPEACMANPLGGIKRGWNEIEQVYRRIFCGPASVFVEFYDFTIHEHAECFVAVGRERGRLEINGDSLELAIRTSRIYVMDGSQWKQLHHHGSMDDHELLQTYQELLK